MLVSGGREAMVMAPLSTHDSTVSPCFHGCPAFLPGISHHNLLHIPSICLSTVIGSPCPGIAPQSLNSSSQLLYLPGDPCHIATTSTFLSSVLTFLNRSWENQSCKVEFSAQVRLHWKLEIKVAFYLHLYSHVKQVSFVISPCDHPLWIHLGFLI